MKKFTVASIIVGAFIFYCLLYHTSAIAPVPVSSNDVRSSTGSSTSAAASTPGGAGTPGAGSSYKDGSYTGSIADAHWGNIQVKAIIQNGKITAVQFLQYPNDRNRSIAINEYADPQLSSEAIQVQNANVDVVTGATDTSEAFIQSLSDALAQAR